MPHLPVYDTRLKAAPLAEYLQTLYPFLDVVEARILKTGINHTYLLRTTTDSYIFRLYFYQWRSRLEIEEEVRLLLHLKASEVPVSYPIADKNGVYLQEIEAHEGLRFGVLFSFAAGEKVRFFSPDHSYTIGQAMARFHKATQNFDLQRPSYTSETLLKQSLERIRTYFAPDSETMKYIERIVPLLTDVLDSTNTTSIRAGVVHLDIWFDNLNIAPDGKATFFDFDFSGNGWQCLDLAYYNIQLFNTEPDTYRYEEKLARFWAGYEAIQPASDEEKALIPPLAVCIWLFYLGIQCQRYDDWCNLFISEDYLKRFIGMAQRWSEKHGLFADM